MKKLIKIILCCLYFCIILAGSGEKAFSGEPVAPFAHRMGMTVRAAESDTKTMRNLYYWIKPEGEILITGSPAQEEITIPAEIDGIPVVGIAENAFLNRNDIKKVTIQPGVRYVGEYAFAGCEALETVTFGEGLQYIGTGAFSGDGSLEAIRIPDSVAFVGENAFGDCTGLETVTFPQTAHVDDYAFEGSLWQKMRDGGGFQIRGSCLISAEGKEGDTLEIPYGVTKTVERPSVDGYTDAVVGQYRSYKDNVRRYDEIILPETLVRLGDGSFNCTEIDRLSLPPSIREIGKFAFHDAILGEVLLPDGLKVIEDWAFSGSSLTRVKLPDTLELLKKGAFCETPLTEIEIPASCYVDTHVFSSCHNLSEITFAEGVTAVNIGFGGGKALERIQFPESLRVIDGVELANYSSVKRIYIPEGATVIDAEKFFREFVICDESVVVYGQKGSRAEEVAKAWGMEFVEVASGDEMP